MKKLLIIICLLAVVPMAYGAATPTPEPTATPITPTPSPSVTPTPQPDTGFVPTNGMLMNLYLDWTSAQTDTKLKWNWTDSAFTVPAGRMFVVEGVKWSCSSDCVPVLEFDGTTSDIRIDKNHFPADGQGGVIVPWQAWPPWSGMSVVITVGDSTGTINVTGRLR